MTDYAMAMNKDNLQTKPIFKNFQLATQNWSFDQMQAFITYLWIYNAKPTFRLISKFDVIYNTNRD